MDKYALAHGIHYAIVAIGAVGILALLLPQLHERRTTGQGLVRAPRDHHEERVLQLRESIASGSLGTTLVRTAPQPAPSAPPALMLPLAFVASTAAAGVHAAMGPSHLRESALFGLFFACSALAQVAWSGALLVRCSRGLLVAGALGNAACIALWAVTRTVGLPVLLPEPEAVGPWDVACVTWEVLVVVACLRLLSTSSLPGRLAPWHRWDGRVTAFAVGSAALLAGLSVSGFSG